MFCKILEKIKGWRGEGAPALYIERQARVRYCKRGEEPAAETDAEATNLSKSKFHITVPVFDLAVAGAVLWLLGKLFGKR